MGILKLTQWYKKGLLERSTKLNINQFSSNLTKYTFLGRNPNNTDDYFPSIYQNILWSNVDSKLENCSNAVPQKYQVCTVKKDLPELTKNKIPNCIIIILPCILINERTLMQHFVTNYLIVISQILPPTSGSYFLDLLSFEAISIVGHIMTNNIFFLWKDLGQGECCPCTGES